MCTVAVACSFYIILNHPLKCVCVFVCSRPTSRTETARWLVSCKTPWVETVGPPSSFAARLPPTMKRKPSPLSCSDRGGRLSWLLLTANFMGIFLGTNISFLGLKCNSLFLPNKNKLVLQPALWGWFGTFYNQVIVDLKKGCFST